MTLSVPRSLQSFETALKITLERRSTRAAHAYGARNPRLSYFHYDVIGD